MTPDQAPPGKPHIVWVEYNDVRIPLHVAGRLEMTRALRKLGWRVTLVLIGPSGQQVVNGVDVHCISRPEGYFVGTLIFHLRFLLFVLRGWSEIDVLLFHAASAPWLLPLRLLRGLRGDKRPLFLMDTRDLVPPGRALKRRIHVLFEQMAYSLARHWADGQTAITQRMADLVHVLPGQLWGTWPSGASLEQFASARSTRKWPAEGEPIHLVYVGVLLYERNLLAMCQAVESANAGGRRFTFSLYGDGEARSDLEAFAAHTAGRISMYSPIPHDQLVLALARAHVGVTSLFFVEQELFQASSPLKLLEYLAAGLPVLATRMACHSDIIGDGQYAFWIDQAEPAAIQRALELVWQARADLSRLGSQAAAAATAWTWEAAAKKLQAAVQLGLDRQPRAALAPARKGPGTSEVR